MSSVKKSTSMEVINTIDKSEKKKKFSKLAVGDWFVKEDPSDENDDVEVFVKTSEDDEEGDINAFSSEEVSIDGDEKVYPIKKVKATLS